MPRQIDREIYIPGESIRDFLERGGAYTPENTMQFDERGNEIRSKRSTKRYPAMNISEIREKISPDEMSSVLFTNLPERRGKPGVVFLKDMPQEPDLPPASEVAKTGRVPSETLEKEQSVYDKWQGFRKHLIDTRFGGIDPDTFNPINEIENARKQYIQNAIKSYGRHVSPQVAKVVFAGADKYAKDIVSQKKYKVDSSRNELKNMLDWFKEQEKPKVPRLITGVDEQGRPIRVSDVLGARPYEKPEKTPVPTGDIGQFYQLYGRTPRDAKELRDFKEATTYIKPEKPEYSHKQALAKVSSINSAIARMSSTGSIDPATAIQFPALAAFMNSKDPKAVAEAISSLKLERDYVLDSLPKGYAQKQQFNSLVHFFKKAKNREDAIQRIRKAKEQGWSVEDLKKAEKEIKWGW